MLHKLRKVLRDLRIAFMHGKAFKKIDTYKGEVSFGAWLKKIVINRSLDVLETATTD